MVHCRRNLEKRKVLFSIGTCAFLSVSCGHRDGLTLWGPTVKTCDSSWWITELNLTGENPQPALKSLRCWYLEGSIFYRRSAESLDQWDCQLSLLGSQFPNFATNCLRGFSVILEKWQWCSGELRCMEWVPVVLFRLVCARVGPEKGQKAAGEDSQVPKCCLKCTRTIQPTYQNNLDFISVFQAASSSLMQSRWINEGRLLPALIWNNFHGYSSGTWPCTVFKSA